MKWITKYIYVDLETQEITGESDKIVEEEKTKDIIIIKTKKTKAYVDHSTRLTEITKWYRRNTAKQQQLPL